MTTIGAGTEGHDGHAARGLQPAAGVILLGLLLSLNVVRTLRHAMWRDELQIFQLAANSPSLFDLFANLRYEAHGPLWGVVLWTLSHLGGGPVAMQVLHVAIATATWLVVYRWSPFTMLETFLLLLSYVLFFEYFVISRGYGLGALLGFAFIAMRHHRPSWRLLPWLTLGLLATINAFVTIWSLALAAGFILDSNRRGGLRFWAGAGVYMVLLAVAIATMIPAADFGPQRAQPAFDLGALNYTAAVTLGAFVPIDPNWFPAAAAFATTPQSATVPFFWNPLPVRVAFDPAYGVAGRPLALALMLIAPILVCALLTRQKLRVMEFSLAFTGTVLFAVLWNYAGGSRHYGFVFLAMIASVWLARARARTAQASWLLLGILAVNAFGGLLSLGSEFTVFSQARNAARWLEQNSAGAPLIGSRDAQVSTIAGYLGRPIEYLECECAGTFVVWNRAREAQLTPEQFRERLARALARTGPGMAIVIRSMPLDPSTSTSLVPGRAIALAASFTGATTDENYWIYRVTSLH